MVGGIGGNGGPGIKGVGTPLKAQESFGAKFKRFVVKVAEGIARAAFAIAQPVQSLLGLIDRIAIRSRSARVGRAPEDAPRAARALDPESGSRDRGIARVKAQIKKEFAEDVLKLEGGGLTKPSDVDGRVCDQFVRDRVDGRGGLVLTDRGAGTRTTLEPARSGDKEGQREKIDQFVAFCGGDESLSFAVSQFANQATEMSLMIPLQRDFEIMSLRSVRSEYELLKEGDNYTLNISQSFEVTSTSAGRVDPKDNTLSYTIQIPLARAGEKGGTTLIPHGEIEPVVRFDVRLQR